MEDGLAAIAAKETETDTDISEAEPAGGDMPQPPSGGQQMGPRRVAVVARREEWKRRCQEL
ncbi:MAG: hypothetical protein SPK00_01480 [Corynebacterium glucuronolyticum]|nr:hypothetical protein [Mycobacteriaceae bacterium]MDY5833413.1 hypothetical protein [Corynebacterium glucuronolyticum]